MTPKFLLNNNPTLTKNFVTAMIMGIVLVGVMVAPGIAAAQDFGGADQKICGFFTNINGLLNMASIAVVTIAVVFAGYQIAFAHKRIADVAPILIGGLLIGAAGQVAKMLIGDTGQQCSAQSGSMILHFISTHYA